MYSFALRTKFAFISSAFSKSLKSLYLFEFVDVVVVVVYVVHSCNLSLAQHILPQPLPHFRLMLLLDNITS